MTRSASMSQRSLSVLPPAMMRARGEGCQEEGRGEEVNAEPPSQEHGGECDGAVVGARNLQSGEERGSAEGIRTVGLRRRYPIL